MVPSQRERNRHEDALTLALRGERISERDFEDVIMDLISLRHVDFKVMADCRPALRSRTTVNHLNRHAHALLSRAPHEALLLSELCIRVADALRSGEIDEAEIIHARGDAWQHRAAALIEIGDFSEAINAVATADTFYTCCDIIRSEGSPCLALLKARILQRKGDFEDALSIADETASLFLTIYEDRRRYVIARVFCANILLTMGRYTDAITAFDKAAGIAEELQDTSTLAHIAASMGNTLTRIGHHQGACEQYTNAMELFEMLHQPVEIARMRIRIGIGMVMQGEFDEAITELERSREEFLRLGMPIVAAQVALEMVNAMLLARRYRWVEPLCRGMIATFISANLHREAQKALGYLNELASLRGGRLRTEDVSYVKDFLERLEDEPSLCFLAPATTQA